MSENKMTGTRKYKLYLITFFTLIAFDIVFVLLTKSTTIPFGEGTIIGMFGAVVVGTTAEHFTNKKEGKGDGGEQLCGKRGNVGERG